MNYLMGDRPVFKNKKYYSCGNPLHCGMELAINLKGYMINGKVECYKKDYFFVSNNFFKISLKDLENVYFID